MRKLLIGLGALALLLAAAVLAGPMLVPQDMLKTRLADQVRAATGRELRVNGPISFALLPAPMVRAQDVTFANAPGAKTPVMARLKSLELDLRLRPLLDRRVEVARLTLREPIIALEVDRAGKGNWVFDAPRTAAPDSTAAPAPRTASGQVDVHLDDVRLEGGQVSLLDTRTGAASLLDRIDLRLSLPGLAGPLTAAGSVVWNGETLALKLTAAAPGALLAGQDSVVALALDSAPVTLRLDGTLTGLPPRRTAGTVDLAMPSLRRFAAWAGVSAGLPGEAPGKLTIKGRMTRTPAEIAFADADITLDGMRAQGGLSLSPAGERPLLKGKLDFDRIDLNGYLPPAPGKAAPGAAPAPTAGAPPAARPAEWSDAPIDLSALRAADAELDLTAGSIAYRQVRLDRTRLALNLHAGKLAVRLHELAMYGGAGTGSLGVDGSGKVPAIDLSFALAHVSIEPLLAATAGMDRLSGTGTFNLAVTAQGASQRALIASLDGKGDLALADGVVKGVNLLSLAQSVVPGMAKSEAGDRTTFASLRGSFTINDGVLDNRDLLLKTRLAPISGAGTVNLPQRGLDYRAVADFAGAVQVPIHIGGTFEHPTYRPELAGAAQQLKGLLEGKGGQAPDAGSLLRRLLPR